MEHVQKCIEYLETIKTKVTDNKSIIELDIIIDLLKERIPLIQKTMDNCQ